MRKEDDYGGLERSVSLMGDIECPPVSERTARTAPYCHSLVSIFGFIDTFERLFFRLCGPLQQADTISARLRVILSNMCLRGVGSSLDFQCAASSDDIVLTLPLADDC